MDSKFWLKIVSGVMVGISLAVCNALYQNQVRTEITIESLETLKINLNQKLQGYEDRINKLEYLKETLPDNYVLRREFNKIIDLQNDKIDRIDKNVEKLIDLQMDSRKKK